MGFNKNIKKNNELENKVKELGKGQQTLIQSRKKWKNRYYKERKEKEELYKSMLTAIDYLSLSYVRYKQSRRKINMNLIGIIEILEGKEIC